MFGNFRDKILAATRIVNNQLFYIFKNFEICITTRARGKSWELIG